MISGYLGSNSSETSTHGTRGLVARTSYFPKTNSYLALTPGESGRSGRNPGLDSIRKLMKMLNEFPAIPLRLRRFKIRDSNGRFLLALGKSSLFEPVEQVVTGAFCNLQVQFRPGFQLFLVYGSADRCEDAKPIREFCEP